MTNTPGTPIFVGNGPVEIAITLNRARQRVKTPKIAIRSTRVVLSTAKPITAPVRLTCTVATCSGMVRLNETVGKTGLLASTNYKISKGKTATVFLRLTATGRTVLASVAEKPLREMLIARVSGGTTAEKILVVS